VCGSVNVCDIMVGACVIYCVCVLCVSVVIFLYMSVIVGLSESPGCLCARPAICTYTHSHTHTHTHTLFLSSTHMAYHASISTRENVPITLTEPADSERPTITLMYKNITTLTHNTHTQYITHAPTIMSHTFTLPHTLK